MHESLDPSDRDPEQRYDPADEAWEDNHGDGVTADEVGPGVEGDRDDDLPPVDPDSFEAGGEEPDRGAALRNLLDLAQQSKEIMRRAMSEAVESNPEGFAALLDVPVEDPERYEDELWTISHMIEGDNGSLHDTTVSTVLEKATDDHRDELDAAGLFLWQGVEKDFGVRIKDVPAFTAALQQMETPATAEERQRVAEELHSAVSIALSSACVGILTRQPNAPYEVYDGDPPGELDYTHEVGVPLDQRTATTTDTLAAGYSAAMSRELDRIGAHNLARYTQQHAVAVAEGLETEWAIGQGLRLIGESEWRMGISRYETQEEWDDAYRYLNHLMEVAPNSELTRMVGENIIDDLRTALDEPDLTILPTPGSIGHDDSHYEDRARQAEAARPLLYNALIEVRQILGLPNDDRPEWPEL